MRILFHAINSKHDLETILKISNNNFDNGEKATLHAYQAASTALLAKHAFFPFTKYNYFKQGTKKLDQLIHSEANFDAIYLRTLIKIKAPKILNYSKKSN